MLYRAWHEGSEANLKYTVAGYMCTCVAYFLLGKCEVMFRWIGAEIAKVQNTIHGNSLPAQMTAIGGIQTIQAAGFSTKTGVDPKPSKNQGVQ